MARNPLYPRSAGETALDKLLNQTLPRILADRQNRKREDEQFDYRKDQDRKAEQRYADSVGVAADKTTYDRLQDDKADIRRAISFAKQAESDGDFSGAYDYYKDAEELADEKGLTDTFQPTIDRSMSTGMIDAGNDNRFNSIYAKLKGGDDATFNKAMDDYLKMSSQGRISDANEKRFKAEETLQSVKTDSRFKSYYGSEVTDDYKDFNKQYQTNVFNKVGYANNVKKPIEFAQQAQIEGKSIDEYYEVTYGEQDREAAKLFLRTEVVGSESFKNLYNNSSETMKQALNKTIVDAYRIANVKDIKKQIIASGIKESDPTFGNRVNQAIRNNALSPENLPGVNVKATTKPLTRKEAEALLPEGSPSITPKGPVKIKEPEPEPEPVLYKDFLIELGKEYSFDTTKFNHRTPKEVIKSEIARLKEKTGQQKMTEEGKKQALILAKQRQDLEKFIKTKEYLRTQKIVAEENLTLSEYKERQRNRMFGRESIGGFYEK